MDALDSINDVTWDLLDMLRLGDFFDERDLPPLLFPLTVILLALLLIWMTAGGAPPCGDGFCASNENCATCPLDCGQCEFNVFGGMIVTVDIIGTVEQPATVTIYDKDGNVLESSTERRSSFEFTSIEPQIVQAEISCPNGKKQSSRPRKVDPSNNVINLLLPDGCFEYITDVDNEPLATHGTVEVKVIDSVTRQSVDATISALRQSDDLSEEISSTVDGGVTLNLRADNWYYLTATRSGYESYADKTKRFYMIAQDTIYREIELNALASTEDGQLRVCATSSSGPVSSGRISILEVGGRELDSATLGPGDNGCVTFTVEAGKSVKAMITSLPSGCVLSGLSRSVSVYPGLQQSVDLDVSCGQDVAYVKVMVNDREGKIITDEVTVTLWNSITKEQIPGNSPDSSLSLGSTGYTESVPIPANTLIQAKASGVPLGYVDTVSGPGAFTANEHGSINIVLGETSRGQFVFHGASIIYTPATPGTPIKVFVQQIDYNQTQLTDQNSEVVVIINGEAYPATFIQNSI